MSKRFKKLSHTIHECKYHFAICPEYRFRIFKGELFDFNLEPLKGSIKEFGVTNPPYLLTQI